MLILPACERMKFFAFQTPIAAFWSVNVVLNTRLVFVASQNVMGLLSVAVGFLCAQYP